MIFSRKKRRGSASNGRAARATCLTMIRITWSPNRHPEILYDAPHAERDHGMIARGKLRRGRVRREGRLVERDAPLSGSRTPRVHARRQHLSRHATRPRDQPDVLHGAPLSRAVVGANVPRGASEVGERRAMDGGRVERRATCAGYAPEIGYARQKRKDRF